LTLDQFWAVSGTTFKRVPPRFRGNASLQVDSYDTSAMNAALSNRTVLIGDVACITLPPKPETAAEDGEGGKAAVPEDYASGPPVAFFFSYGAAVLWGFTQAEEAEVLLAVRPWEGVSLPKDETDVDRMSFSGAVPVLWLAAYMLGALRTLVLVGCAGLSCVVPACATVGTHHALRT